MQEIQKEEVGSQHFVKWTEWTDWKIQKWNIDSEPKWYQENKFLKSSEMKYFIR